MKEDAYITAREVKEKLKNKNDNFLLVDIRDENEYKDWNIQGSLNLPINGLLANGHIEEMKKHLMELPRDKEIITICARGINSQVAAGVLRELNYKAIHMEKGMKGWNENYDIYGIDIGSKDISLSQFVRIGKGCLSYVAWSESTREAAVFDPSIFLNEYLDFLRDKDLKVKYVVDTHSHADHFSGGMGLAKALSISYYVNEIDVDNGFDYSSLESVKNLELGNSSIEVFSTPGHTDGSLSFLIDAKALICGDLLLLESVGRPDLARSAEETIRGAGILYDTINNTVLKFDDSVRILPAHFVSTTIRPISLSLGEMKQQNKTLTISDKKEFIKYITESMPQTPPNYESIKQYNKKGIAMPLEYAEDVEIGPNRCAARN